MEVTKYGAFNRRTKADKAFDTLKKIAKRYGYATESDIYSMMGYNNHPYSSYNYGWTCRELDGLCYPVKVRDGGFYLDLPKPTCVNDMVIERSIRYDHDCHCEYLDLDIVVVTDEITNWKDTLKLISELVNENENRKVHITIK